VTPILASTAVKAGANVVITCEPTFYSRSDSPTPARRGAAPDNAAPTSAPDRVFAAKRDFIEKNDLVVSPSGLPNKTQM
jgi:hypothetical protein